MTGGTQGSSSGLAFEKARELHRQGQLAEAEPLYRAALAVDPGNADAKEWLGALCLQQGRPDEAIGWLGAAASDRPGNAVYQDNLAAALVRSNRPAEAAAIMERALSLPSGALERRQRLGDLLLQLGHRGKAMEMYRQAIESDPRVQAGCRDTQSIVSEEERCAAIIENCRHILALYPGHAYTHYCMATALFRLGRIEEARRASERALVLDPTVPTYYHVLILSGDTPQNANALSAMEQLAGQEASLDAPDRATLHFLLAKAYDDGKRIDEAFDHLSKANAIKRAAIRYDEAREIGRLEAIAAAFSAERLAALRGQGCASEIPVFIVGMPRSGTTLCEQILASHPKVYGAGESTALSDLVAGGAAGKDFPACFSTVTGDALARLGEAYAARHATLAPAAERVIDKLPYNFRNVGLIHLALPRARIIHIRRDPLDTCFSCFQQSFSGEVGFAYDLGELGRYFRAYEALMAHWRDVLPEGAMLELRYEDLVADLPGLARRLVEYCGIAWDERCLEFHKNPRAVLTASLYQVRQPVYRSAVGRAEAYMKHLAPLRDALGLS